MNIKNDNIANVLAYTEIEGKTYSVNEFISGETLEEYVTYNGKISDSEIKKIALDICSGLSAVHSLGIVHRDITPGNIIIDSAGRAIITDFGISRLTNDKKQKDTQILGTVGYAAPEQFGFRQTTAKADIYAVGTLINYMSEGVLPVDHLTDGRFKKIVVKCTMMDEMNRYKDIDELAAAIDKNAKLELIIKRIPGFGGSKALRAAAIFYYISVIFSALIYLAKPGERIMSVFVLLFFIIPPVIIFDPLGKISSFCQKRNLSRGKRRLVKAALIFAAIEFICLLIIAVFY